jgi:hypothetical protein
MVTGVVHKTMPCLQVTRISSGINSSSSSLLPVEPLSALVAGFQQLQYGVLHTSSRCSQAHEDGGSSSSSSSTTGSTPGSSAAGDSSTSKPSSAVEGDATQEPKQNAAGAWGARFATVSERFSGTGYPESFLQTTAQQQQQRQPETAAGPSDNASTEATTTTSSSSSDEQQQQRQRRKPLFAGVQLPPEVLRVPLTQEAQQEQAEVTVDAYSLSRWVQRCKCAAHRWSGVSLHMTFDMPHAYSLSKWVAKFQTCSALLLWSILANTTRLHQNASAKCWDWQLSRQHSTWDLQQLLAPAMSLQVPAQHEPALLQSVENANCCCILSQVFGG